MAKIYYKRILAGIMTVDDVPNLWKKQVQKLLDADKNNEDTTSK
jgi:Zn-dependent M32 family carboxypeptidase